MVLLLLSIGLNFLLPIKQILYSPYTYLGIMPILFGIVINIWADALFKKRSTTVKPHETPTYFETSGPFRISRHPMYLGMVAILLGVAVLLGSLTSFLSPVLFITLMDKIFIPMEERNMEKTFGDKYMDYKKKVRRWI